MADVAAVVVNVAVDAAVPIVLLLLFQLLLLSQLELFLCLFCLLVLL